MLEKSRIYAVLPASDLERAKRWYEEKLGLTPKEEEMGSLWYQFAEGTYAIVTPSGFAGTAQNTAAGWTVDDIEAMMEEMRGRGVMFEEYDFPDMKTENGLFAMGPVKAAWFKDSEGNTLELSQISGG